MTDIKNALSGLCDIYNKAVADADELGCADTFKKCAEIFFRCINIPFPESDALHIADISYLDGYFIFGMGTNSVVHFHVAECPGWKFGIWWDVAAGNNPHMTGQFFCTVRRDD